MTRALRLAVFFSLFAVGVAAQSETWIIPQPARVLVWEPEKLVEMHGGLTANPTLGRVSWPVSDAMFRRVGRRPVIWEYPHEHDGTFRVDETLEPGACSLKVSDHELSVVGGDTAGLARAVAILMQCIDDEGRVPTMTIEDDAPAGHAMVWLDVARKFHTVEELEALIDVAGLLGISHIGLHLTDDQNVMFPFEAFPNVDDGNAHGKPAYTREDLERLTARALKYELELVPELDVPGHSTRLRAAYPDVFGDDGGSIDLCLPECRAAVLTMVDEMCEVFKASSFLHIGGDESSALHRPEFPLFIHEVRDHLAARGKRTMVWEGFPTSLSDDMPDDLLVVAWSTRYHRPDALLDAGFEVINASWDPLYVVEHYPWNQWTYHTPARILAHREERFGHVDDGMPGSAPIVVENAENVVGSMLCWWEGRGASALPLLVPRMAAFAEATRRQGDIPDHAGFPTRLDRFLETTARIVTAVQVDTTNTVPGSLPHRRQIHAPTTTITLRAPDAFEIRYAIDGPVTEDSPTYEGPFDVAVGAVLQARIWSDKFADVTPTRVELKRVSLSEPSLATGCVVTSDSDEYTEHVLARVVDGVIDPDERWIAYTPPHSVDVAAPAFTIDLGTVKAVGRFMVHAPRFQSGYREAYRIDGSRDGVLWDRLVDTGSEGNATVEGGIEHVIAPTSIRFVRWTSLGNSSFPGGNVARLCELEVFAP